MLIVIESLLGARFILRLFNANPRAEIVKFFYQFTHPFIAPFDGIFPDLTVLGGTVDMVVFSAAVAYALAFFLLKAIFVRK